MSEPIDLDAGWESLSQHDGAAETFAESPVCRAVFGRIPNVLGNLGDELAIPENVARARLLIALDADAVDALRDAGFRFAEPPSRGIPLLLCVNGDRARRKAAARYHAKQDLPVLSLLSTWPQSLVWFAKR